VYRFDAMSRIARALVLSALIGVAFVVLALPARAGQDVAYLIEQLRTSDDYRVRTQAALALGASGDGAAVKPLCDALGDGNSVVKVAAAAALGKLGKPEGLPCLKAALAKETNASAKAQQEKSIAALEKGGSAGAGAAPSAPATPPPPGPDAKYYIAIQVTNKTTRPAADVDAIVRSAMQDKLLSKAGFAVAPKSESSAQGSQVVKQKKLKGFYLVATVEAPVYAGGDLTQTVRVTMWSYPDKALQGELAPKLTQSSTSPGDVQSETALMKMCAENAVESFQRVASTL
jgi:hypothetical protein